MNMTHIKKMFIKIKIALKHRTIENKKPATVFFNLIINILHVFVYLYKKKVLFYIHIINNVYIYANNPIFFAYNGCYKHTLLQFKMPYKGCVTLSGVLNI